MLCFLSFPSHAATRVAEHASVGNDCVNAHAQPTEQRGPMQIRLNGLF